MREADALRSAEDLCSAHTDASWMDQGLTLTAGGAAIGAAAAAFSPFFDLSAFLSDFTFVAATGGGGAAVLEALAILCVMKFGKMWEDEYEEVGREEV